MNNADISEEVPNHLLDFLNTSENHEDGLIEALGGLLSKAQGEDYKEQDFASKMKKMKAQKKLK